MTKITLETPFADLTIHEQWAVNNKLTKKHLGPDDWNREAERKFSYVASTLPTLHSLSRITWIQSGTVETYKNEFESRVKQARQSWRAFDQFIEANPHVSVRRSQVDPCENLLRTGRRHWHYNASEKYQKGKQIDHGSWSDHPELWKVSKKPEDIFLIAHPYNEPGKFTEPISDDLQAIRLPKKYSWYYPNQTFLVLIGRPEIISQINIDYTNKR